MEVLNIVCLWVGRVVLSLIGLAIALSLLAVIVAFIVYYLQKPWYAIRGLLPFWWVDKAWYKKYKKICHRIQKYPDNYADWKKGTYIKRKGRIAVLAIPNTNKKRNPVNHYFYIKKS